MAVLDDVNQMMSDINSGVTLEFISQLFCLYIAYLLTSALHSQRHFLGCTLQIQILGFAQI